LLKLDKPLYNGCQTASFQIALRNFGSWSFLNATTSPFSGRFCSVSGMKQNFSLFEISLDFLVLLYQDKRTEESKRKIITSKIGELLLQFVITKAAIFSVT